MFSTKNCWPRLSESRCATMRAMTSVGPPGGNPTTTRTGRFGYPCANDAATPDSNNAAARNRRKPCFMGTPVDMFVLAPSSAGTRYRARAKRAGRPSLLLQQRLDPVFQFLERHRAFELFTIDEEGRRGVDLQFFKGEFLIGGELVEQGLILLAGLDSLFAHAGLVADQLQGIYRLRHQLILLFEQRFDGAEKFPGIVIGDAAPKNRCSRNLDLGRVFHKPAP